MNVLFSCGRTAATLGRNTSGYCSCLQGGGNAGWSSAENRQNLDIRVTGTFSLLWIYISANNISNDSTCLFRKNGANGNILITVPASSGATTLEDTSNTDTVAVDDAINYAMNTGVGSGSQSMTIQMPACQFAPTSGTTCVCGIGADITHTSANDSYPTFQSGGSAPTETEANAQNTIAFSATIDEFYITATGNTRSDTVNLYFRINGASGNLTVQYASGGGTGEREDTTNSDSVADGDEVNVLLDQNGGSGTLTARTMKVEVTATDAQWAFAGNHSGRTQNSALTRYHPTSGILVDESTEINKQIKVSNSYTWSDLYAYCTEWSLNSGALTLRSRKNVGNGNLVLSFTGTGTLSDLANSDSLGDEDEFNYSAVTGGTSGSVTLRSISSMLAAPAGPKSRPLFNPSSPTFASTRRYL